MTSPFCQFRSTSCNVIASDTSNPEDVDRLLTADSNKTHDRNWPRLDNTERVGYLRTFAEEHGKKNDMSDEAIAALKNLLEDAVRKKKLTRVKEVVYDKVNKKVVSIPGLEFDAMTMCGRIIRSKSKKSENN